MKSKEIFSGLPVHWLGIALLALALLAFFFTLFFNRPAVEPYVPSRSSTQVRVTEGPDDGSGEKKNLLEKLDFQKKHQQFQTSYLDLINKIGSIDTTKITPKDRALFTGYSRAKADFTDTLKKVEDYEKDFRLKCFARMRSLILAVLFYDRKTGARMTRFDPDELVKIGALQEIPVCPRGGRYSIVYKDGRRLFHCSIHGTLKN